MKLEMERKKKDIFINPKDLKYRSMSFHKDSCSHHKSKRLIYTATNKYRLGKGKKEQKFKLPNTRKKMLDYMIRTKPRLKKRNFEKYALKKILLKYPEEFIYENLNHKNYQFKNTMDDYPNIFKRETKKTFNNI